TLAPAGGSAAATPRPGGGITASTLPPPTSPAIPAPVPTPGPSTAAGFPPALPAEYAGTLPCADCAGIEYSLTLEPRDRYTLVRRYLGRQGEPEFTERGGWRYDPSARKLTLGGAPPPATVFEVRSADRLRLLDVTGQPIVSELNYELVRGGAEASVPPAYAPPATAPALSVPPPYPPAVASRGPMVLGAPGTTDAPVRRVRGLYRGSTDGATFVECGDSRAVAVAAGGQGALLASAYQRARPQPGEAVLVELDGRVGLGPLPSGAGLGRTLAVERFVAIRPGESCAPPAQPAPATWSAPDGRPPLRETTWRLLAVGAQTVAPSPGGKLPFLELNADLPVFSGNAGCNGIGGEYALSDQSLSFTLGPSTRMACPGAMELEQAFRDALAKATTWNITGDHLTLYGPDGTALLRFTARPV
ncbi:MAG: META domain-containing protein, partial [Thalassobaculum sp.]